MALPDPDSVDNFVPASGFATTHWSVVLQARETGTAGAEAALETLCRDYWRPLHAYVRRRGHPPEEAADLIQTFFERLLSKDLLSQLTPGMGRFRSFLLSCLSHFLANEWDRVRAQKRGGTITFVPLDSHDDNELGLAEPSAPSSPEQFFDRQWALTVLEKVLTRLRNEFRASEKSLAFENLEPFLSADPPAGLYLKVAARTGLKEGTVKVAVHRLRRRYGELLRAELLRTVSDPSDVEDEIRYLLRAVASSAT